MYLLRCKDMKYSGKQLHPKGKIFSILDHKVEYDYDILTYDFPTCKTQAPTSSEAPSVYRIM